MAANVFGNPVTDEITKEYFPEPITQLKRAKVAYQYINANGRDTNAMQFVENLKQQFGNGISTLCLIYNATGGDVSFVTTHDYHGSVWKVSYPTVFQNGQWAAFLHVRSSIFVGSSGAVVYRGRNNKANEYDYMCAWSIPLSGDNHAYTEIRDKGHFDPGNNRWGVVGDKMANSGLAKKDKWEGCESSVSIGNNSTSVYQAILTLEGVLQPTRVYALPPTTVGIGEVKEAPPAANAGIGEAKALPAAAAGTDEAEAPPATAGIDEAPKPPPTTTSGIADDPPTTAAAAGIDEEA